MRYRKQVNVCQCCGKTFYSSRNDAKFCGVNCRMNFSRTMKRGTGKTWHYVSEAGKTMATELRKVSPVAYQSIEVVLNYYGATAAEYAILAAYTAAHDCIAIQEGKV